MDEHIEWLRRTRDEIKSLLEETVREFHEVEHRLSKLRNEYDTWNKTLRFALQRAGKPIEDETPVELKGTETKGFRKGSIPDLCQRIIFEKGPLAADELLLNLEAMGKKVSLVSVTGALHRYKPDVFDNNNDGKWCLAPHKGSGSEEIQAASEQAEGWLERQGTRFIIEGFRATPRNAGSNPVPSAIQNNGGESHTPAKICRTLQNQGPAGNQALGPTLL